MYALALCFTLSPPPPPLVGGEGQQILANLQEFQDCWRASGGGQAWGGGLGGRETRAVFETVWGNDIDKVPRGYG